MLEVSEDLSWFRFILLLKYKNACVKETRKKNIERLGDLKMQCNIQQSVGKKHENRHLCSG
jgi:hypothetical protein